MKRVIIATLLILINCILLAGCHENPVIPSVGATPTKMFTINPYFQDGAIFLQKSALVIEGISEKDVVLTAELFDNRGNLVNKIATIASENGKYSLGMNAPRGSYDEYKLIISDTVHQLVINEILFGEVWLLAGEYANKTTPEASRDSIVSFLVQKNGKYDWISYEEEGSTGLVSSYVYKLASEMSAKLDLPVGIINATTTSAHIDAWLSLEVIDEHPSLKDFLVNEGRYTEAYTNNSSDQMAYMYDNMVFPFSTIAVKGIVWSQGETNLQKDFVDSASKRSYFRNYTACLSFLINDFHQLFGKDTSILVVQATSSYNDDIVMLRNVQAAATYYYSYADIIPTYDICEEVLNEAGEQMLILDETVFIERLSTIIVKKIYNGRTTYSIPSFTNMIVNDEKIAIEFFDSYMIQKVEKVEGLLIYDEFGNILDLEINIHDNWLEIMLPLPKEDEEPLKIKKISYGQAGNAQSANLVNLVGMPVIPFEITIKE